MAARAVKLDLAVAVRVHLVEHLVQHVVVHVQAQQAQQVLELAAAEVAARAGVLLRAAACGLLAVGEAQ